MNRIDKYPRTRHIEGSRLQPGDHDLSAVPWRELRGLPLVIEEKVDGANCAISFSKDGELLLQSRGHYLNGGARERQFGLLKSWASRHCDSLHSVLGRRYVMYGEWLYAKHTIFYDALPHYFLEFDILDRDTGVFLSTPARRALLRDLPVAAVPVIASGQFESVTELIGRSAFKSVGWLEAFREQCAASGYSVDRAWQETDLSDSMEGLYIKLEEDGCVRGRFKYVRASFLTSVLDSGTHWQHRPILPNLLAPGVSLFA